MTCHPWFPLLRQSRNDFFLAELTYERIGWRFTKKRSLLHRCDKQPKLVFQSAPWLWLWSFFIRTTHAICRMSWNYSTHPTLQENGWFCVVCCTICVICRMSQDFVRNRSSGNQGLIWRKDHIGETENHSHLYCKLQVADGKPVLRLRADVLDFFPHK